MDWIEGVGESSSPPRSFSSFSNYDVRNDVCNRLLESCHDEALCNPDFRERLEAHFNRLPPSYTLDVNMDRVEDVLLHQRLLEAAKDPGKRPVYYIRFLENISAGDGGEQQISVFSTSKAGSETRDAIFIPSHSRQESLNIPIHEVIFSTVDKPKLLCQLSALLSDIGLNIREAHVFSTIDGYSLAVFVVDGWPVEETDGLYEAMEKAVSQKEGSLSRSSKFLFSHASVEKLLTEAKQGDWEIDQRYLNIGEQIASGSCGDLFHGVYLGENVAIKVIRGEHLTNALEEEFEQELAILRQVHHNNVVRFIGASTKSPLLCIVTEYMAGGSLYDYLHKSHNKLELFQLLKVAIDVCKGMEYLHQNNIIHRDLKTANLLMDAHNVVKVADFGIARFQNQGGVMTAETGTYRWMAPEVINHEPYDQKADVFSFSIVLWELVTAKVPYDNLTPLQAALGVRQGLRPELPKKAHPKLIELMKRCWEAIPSKRPSFSEISFELETLQQEIESCKLQKLSEVNGA